MVVGLVSTGLARPQSKAPAATAKARVTEAERAFAATMARRDHRAFAGFISEEAVFLGDDEGKRVLRGRRAVTDAWKSYFEGPAAPFSWEPQSVEVLDSGVLALSTGPVRNPQGDLIGRFTSIWRLERGGQWRVIFDRGCSVCK
jgi:ketosteroid isomerase-like protein